MGKKVYCHFSFRRPKGKHYGLFAVALFADEEGKVLVAAKTRAYPLWYDQQYVTAIQAYEHALYCIWEWQHKLMQHGVTDVLLVTDNSALASWIANPRKNKKYERWMRRANSQYKVGGPKEILLNVGLCEPRVSEKSYKYCTLDRVCNKIPEIKEVKGYKLDIPEYKSVNDILSEEQPEGMDKLKEIDTQDIFIESSEEKYNDIEGI